MMEEHSGFSNQSEMVRFLMSQHIANNKQQSHQPIINKKKINEDFDSKALQLADDLLHKRKNARTIVRDIDSKKTTPEIVTHAVWHLETVFIDVKGTRELKSMMDVVEREIVTKKDSKSLRKYDTIMKICPDRIRRGIEKVREEEEREQRRIERQTKMPQYPKPPQLEDDIPDDMLEPYQENEDTEPEEINERDLIVR